MWDILSTTLLQHNKVKLGLLNVNALGNPIKRTKVIAVVYIIFLQETHFSPQEHEKLKSFDFKNNYYNSYLQSHRRSIAIIISNKIKFVCPIKK